MGTLTVFGTEGQAFYPPDGDPNPPPASYFDNVNFSLDLSDPDHPLLEAYLRVKTAPSTQEQVFLRYRGDSTDSLFADCRAAVKQHLVDGQGWSFDEQPPRNRPEYLFMATVWDSSLRTPAPSTGTRLESDAELVEHILTADDTEPLEVTGTHYGVLAGLIDEYRDLPLTLVAMRSTRQPAGADLVLRREPLPDPVTLPQHSHELLDREEERRRKEKRAAAFQSIDESVGTVLALGADADHLKDQLNRIFDHHSLSLTVETERRIQSLRRERQRAREAAHRAEATTSDGGTVSGRLPTAMLRSRKGLGLGLAVVVLVLAVVAGLHFGLLPPWIPSVDAGELFGGLITSNGSDSSPNAESLGATAPAANNNSTPTQSDQTANTEGNVTATSSGTAPPRLPLPGHIARE